MTVKESNLLTDPDLEGTYTAGLAAPFTKGGSPTVSQSAGADTINGSATFVLYPGDCRTFRVVADGFWRA